MGTEIERKFLVVDEGWRAAADEGTRMCQGYLHTGDRASIRVRVAGDRAWLNIKQAVVGASRAEYEYPIPVADGERMLASLCEGPAIEKVRYRVVHEGATWEIDVFDGENRGLVVAEIELGHEAEAFARPPWAGAEVTHERRYYNASLVELPFSRWESDAG